MTKRHSKERRQGSVPAMARRTAKVPGRRPKLAFLELRARDELLSLDARVTGRETLSARGRAILRAATAAGYLHGEKTERIGGRVTRKLLLAAKAKSGLTSQTELLEYALSMIALEDDYGQQLLARKGSVSRDVKL